MQLKKERKLMAQLDQTLSSKVQLEYDEESKNPIPKIKIIGGRERERDVSLLGIRLICVEASQIAIK